MPQTSLVTTYVVNNSSHFVTLNLLIGGAGQVGTSRVRLGNTVQVNNHPGNLVDHPVGQNGQLGGQVLHITTTISDANQDPDNNHTELIVRLSGGVIFREYALSKEVEENGSASYHCQIHFFAV